MTQNARRGKGEKAGRALNTSTNNNTEFVLFFNTN